MTYFSSARFLISSVIVVMAVPALSRAESVRTLALSELSTVAMSMTRPERSLAMIVSVVT